jgi:hypothetical protein
MTYDILFVVRNSASLTSQEVAKMYLMQAWGYSVQTISDGASQLLLNQSAAASKCVFIGEEIISADLNTKLVSSPKGIVFEEYGLVDKFQVAPGITFASSTFLNIVNVTHYIVSTLPMNGPKLSANVGSTTSTPVHLSSSSLQMMSSLNSGWASGLTVLGRHPGRSNFPALLAIRAGGTLMDGSLAAGRRVMLPWGHEDQEFNNLNSNGLTILRRSLEWAMGMGSD